MNTAAKSLLVLFALGANLQAEGKPAIQQLKTPSGIKFAMLGTKPDKPAPLLFVFANDRQTSLTSKDFNQIGMTLGDQGVLSVSLDAPCHGEDKTDQQGNGIVGWRVCTEKGMPWLADYLKKCSEVLDYLVKEGYADPQKIVACGTSRGGFLATHYMAAEPRIRAAATFAPVTNLLAVREFADTSSPDPFKAMALEKLADKLIGRDYWVCIGNNDQRVSTDDCIAFTRAVVKASATAAKPARIEIHVMPSIGHAIHKTAHAEAAAWMAERLKELK
jgi:esterase FrsA